jgi:hypothetical protein
MHRVLCCLIASLAVAALAEVPALATETPPPAPLQAAPPFDVLKGAIQSGPDRCKDSALPHSGFGAKSARAAKRSHVLRGRAHDDRCGVALVVVSIFRRTRHGCQYLETSGVLSSTMSCKRSRWLLAAGTTHWRVTMPKNLPAGTYSVRTLAVDYSANFEHPRTGKRVRRLRLR